MFLFQSLLIQKAFVLFRCMGLTAADPTHEESQLRYLIEDLNIECYTDSHNWWRLTLGSTMIVVYVIGIPFFAWFVLFRNRNNAKAQLKYNFLKAGYKESAWYWEILVMARKLWNT